MTAFLLFLRGNWQLIAIGILAAVIAGMSSRLSHVKGERGALRTWQANVRGVTSTAAHVDGLLALDQVSLQIVYLGKGLDQCHGDLADKNRESQRRADDLKAAQVAAEAEKLAADRRFAESTKSIDRLRAIAARPSDGKCPADPALLRELEGL